MGSQALWLDLLKSSEWENAISAFPDEYRDVYFLPQYLGLSESATSKAQCFIYREDDKVFYHPFLLNRIEGEENLFDVSSVYGYSGPICLNSNREFIERASKAWEGAMREHSVVAELVKFHPLLKNQENILGLVKGTITSMRQIVYVELSIDEENRWQNIYAHANRKNINKAKKNSISIEFGTEELAWNAFRTLYEETMRANQAAGFYYFSEEYFKRLRNNLKENYTLVAAKNGAEILSVMLVLLGKRFAHCHLIGTHRDAQNLGVNNLLHHELIQWSKQQGFSKLMIGGGRTNTEDDSLLKFKKNFSDKTEEFFVGEIIYNKPAYDDLCSAWQMKNNQPLPSGKLFKYRG